jgi:hypothetical protein
MIDCPRTRKPVFVGAEIDPEGFDNMKVRDGEVSCPHCGGLHSWDEKIAYLEGQGRGH